MQVHLFMYLFNTNKAMVKFVRNIFIFIIAVVFIDYTSGYVFDYLSSHSKGSDTKEHHYIANECKAEVLIFGSSRAQHHYNPSIMSDTLGMSVYNCGLDGCGAILSLGRFLLLTERYNPKLVVMDIFSNYDVNVGDNTKYITSLRRYKRHNCLVRVFDLVLPFEKYKNLSNMYCYNGQIIKLIVDYLKEDDSIKQGYLPMTGNINEVNFDKEPDENTIWDDAKRTALIEIVKQCKEKNIKLIFTMSPYFTGYNDSSYKMIERFSEKEGIPFLYHFADSAYIRKPEYFADRSHLNDKGAEKYSSMIAHEIKEIYSKR